MPFVSVNRVGLYYEMFGQGEVLLFVHGLGSSVRDWEKQVEYFKSNYQVLVVDVRGHGKSDKPLGALTIKQMSSDIAYLIEELRLGAVHAVGLSMGGMICFHLTAQYPSLVKSLTVINSAPEFPFTSLRFKMQSWLRLAIVRLLGMHKMASYLSVKLFPNPDQLELRKTFIRRWKKNDPQFYYAALKAIFSCRFEGDLEQISCPVLVLASEEDYTPVSFKKEYVKQMKNAKLEVIKDAHHALPIEKPEIFNDALQDFLTSKLPSMK